MNVFTSACLLIWTGGSLLSALFSANPWPGAIMFALSIVAWLVFSGPDPTDDPGDRTNLRDRDRW